MRVLFGELLKDQPPHLNTGLLTAHNVYAGASGYRPVKAFQASAGSALPDECLGAASFRAPTNTTYLFAGTASDLYRRSSSAWSSVGNGYSASSEQTWEFAQYGSFVIATNGADPVLKFDLASDDSAFVPLGGSPPKMEMLAVVKDFLVGGVIDGDATKVQWSGINDSEFWNAGQGKQADYNVFPAGGRVTGVAGGEYGIVFQERRISRMAYTGDDLIFQFQEISANVGCVAPRSLVQFAGRCYFLSDQGFAATDGQGVQFIGDERVDRSFLSVAVRGNYPRMSAAVDPINKLVVWTEPSTGDPPRWWVYSVTRDRWTTIEQGSDRVFPGFSPDTLLEDLDSIAGNVESVTPDNVDSSLWLGGVPALYVIDNNHALGTMTGANMEATLGLGDLELVPGRRFRLRAVTPLTDADDLTLNLGVKTRLSDDLVTTAYGAINGEGELRVREQGRFIRPELVITAGADWSYAQGHDFDAVAGGGQ